MYANICVERSQSTDQTSYVSVRAAYYKYWAVDKLFLIV